MIHTKPMLFSTAINLLHAAKKEGIDILLNDGQLRIKIPKGKSVDPQFLEEIRMNKTLIIDLLREEKWKSSKLDGLSGIPVRRPEERGRKMPLSFSQERLWFIDQLEGSTAYHVPSILRFTGALDPGALEHAFRSVVNRHEVLRTVIGQEDGVTYQQVMEKDLWSLSVIDDPLFSKDPEALGKCITDLVNRPFDLSEDHKLRAHLIRLGEQEHVLVATMHHIASDGWSGSILVREFGEFYRNYSSGRAPELVPLPVQYGDFAIWQREQLTGEGFDKKAAYWKAQLEGVSRLQLPVDYPFRVPGNITGDRVSRVLGPGLSAGVMELSHREGATLYMALLTVFKILLYRYTGQEDICIGSSIAGRQQTEVEGLIGFFANTLALRSRVTAGMSARELLGAVKQTTLDGYDRQEVPFEKVVELLGVKREAGRNPLFGIMFVLENTPQAGKMEMGGLAWQTEAFGQLTSKFDLTLSIGESPRGLEMGLTYRRNLYSRETMEQLLEHYAQLLASVLASPDQAIGRLEMLGEKEKGQLLEEYGRSRAEYPREKTLVELFREQAARTPSALALVFEEKQLCYGALDERSDRLAAYLLGQGVRRGSLVGLCMDRSPDMIIAVLGILKAGGAYVPIDGSYPEKRIAHILEDTSCGLLLIGKEQEEKMERLRASADNTQRVSIICMQDIPEAVTGETKGVGNVAGEEKKEYKEGRDGLSASDLAYVIYTSGSTGKSKGVMVEHRSLVDYVYGLDKRTGIGACGSFALVSTLSADLGNTMIYCALLRGGVLHVLSEKAMRDGREMTAYFTRHRIDCLKIVPSHWKALSQEGKLLLPERMLIFGGEALPQEWISQIRTQGSDCRIINHYGPTETTIGKILYEVTVAGPGGTVLIGKPFCNTQAYVLSREGELCPAGIAGELYIGGDGVARGYLNRPDLTSERFVENPYAKEEGVRMYRTGDLVRWNAKGELAFLGRVDDQIKIRGFRVETGEVESILREAPEISQAVVVAAGDGDVNRRLIGYVVTGARYDREDVLIFLKNNLPDYMVPALLVELDSLPLTVNGKVDKRALPDPEERMDVRDRYEPPSTETEKKLVAVWEELLGVERIGIHDDFFELGGHSLLAIRLISAIRKRLAAEVSIGEVFDYPTIASLGKQLAGKPGNGMLQAFTSLPRPDRIPLSFAQERLWFIDRLDGSIQYHVPSVLRMKGRLNEGALLSALQEIVNRHEILRTVIEEEDGRPYQRIMEKGKWKLSCLEKSDHIEDKPALASFVDSLIREPFDLSTDHQLRAHLIRLPEQEYLLVIVLHHIASDGWSNDIMVREMIECYGAFAEGREPLLSSLSVQYADYAIWQRNYLAGEVLALKTGYWEKKLAGAETLEMPTDYPRPVVQTSRGAMAPFHVDRALSEKLRHLSRREGTTLFMTLLAAFKVLLYRYSGQTDILVGTVIAGRQQAEVEGLIGFFVNTLVLRSDLGDNPAFTTLLQKVKQTALEAYEHQDVPFEKVVEAVVKKRDMSRNTLFDVLFLLQNNTGTPGTRTVPDGLKGLEIIAEHSGYTTSKFDLNFSLTEEDSGLSGSIEYSTDLYQAETINRMAGHFITLLASLVRTPEGRIGDLLLLTESERQQLTETFNPAHVTCQAEETVLDLFEEQVRRCPDEIALVSGDDKLSFLELSERSDQLAQYLLKKGVKRESLVAICIERSVNMVIGVLGILKAGGAYVPIDPGYPPERIAFMLEDTGVQLILSSRSGRQNLPRGEGLDALVIELDRDRDRIQRTKAAKRKTKISPQQLAYVIYTSGSTGKPKGVMINHENVCSFINWCRDEFADSSFDLAYASTSLCFDLSVFELFYPLSVGKRIRILENGLSCGKYLPGDSSVLLNTVPSVIRFLLEEKTDLSNISVLNMAGENIPPEVLRQLDVNKTAIRNLYGPTETTTYSTCYRIKTGNRCLIGKPVSNTCISIRDTAGELIPVGVTGELWIGGAGVARGYLNRPDLTTERFISDPAEKKRKDVSGAGFSGNTRLYRTGDLCRWLPDGNICFLGRQDAQVKIRGYRIEPGEIERALALSGLVRQGIVVVRKDNGGNKQLVGYVVPDKGFSREAIIASLKKQLPEYMVPGLFVELEQMPLTANGKTDRKALPEPDKKALSGNAFVAPGTETERKLVVIWQTVLHMEKIGVTDNFFELGGHSLLAVQVVSAIRKELSIEIPVKAIFQLSNIGLLARFIQIQLNNLVEETDEYETMKL